jgi:predicted nucleotidyltransferase
MGFSQTDRTGAIGSILFGATRQAVLSLLYGHAEQRFYQKQIIDSAALGSGTVQRELHALTTGGILTRTTEGRQIYYQANRDCPVFAELQGLIRKTFGAAGILRDALLPLAAAIQAAFIYGSVARGTERAGSDIDLMIVAADGPKLTMANLIAAIAQPQRELQREVNPSIYTLEEFCRKIASGHHFLSSVWNDGDKLFLIGDYGELGGLVQGWMAQATQNQPTGNRGSVRRSR